MRDGKSSRAAERGVRRLNSTVAECDRVGDGRADRSSKHTLHGVNAQVATDPSGKILWLSPALPGRTHDLTAARTRQILRICERQGTPPNSPPWPTSAGPLGHHHLAPPARRRTRAHPADREPDPVHSPCARRTRHGTTQSSGRSSTDPASPPPPSVSAVPTLEGQRRKRALPPFRSRLLILAKTARGRELDGRISALGRGEGTEFDSLRSHIPAMTLGPSTGTRRPQGPLRGRTAKARGGWPTRADRAGRPRVSQPS